MWVHMHPIHTPVVVFTTANTKHCHVHVLASCPGSRGLGTRLVHAHDTAVHAHTTSDILVIIQLASKVPLALCSRLCIQSLSHAPST